MGPESMKSLGISWFDFVVLGAVILGLVVGRKRGMSAELLDLFLWLLVIVMGSMFYLPLAGVLASNLNLSPVSSCVLAYLGIAFLLFTIYALMRHRWGGKLVGSDLFGGMEYYLGMVAGVVHFLCILIFLMALLNAKVVTDKQMRDRTAYQKDVYGSTFFPGLGDIQRAVFRESIFGKAITDNLGNLLIQVDQKIDTRGNRENIYQRRGREVDDALGAPRR